MKSKKLIENSWTHNWMYNKTYFRELALGLAKDPAYLEDLRNHNRFNRVIESAEALGKEAKYHFKDKWLD